MCFIPLEFFERREIGVAVTEADDESDRDQIVVEMVQVRAAISIGIQWPSGGVDHQARHVLFGFHFPKLFQSQTIDLGVASFAQFEFVLQLLTEIATASFSKKSIFGVQLHSAGITTSVCTVFADAHVARGNTSDCTHFIEEHFCRRKSRINLHAEFFSFCTQPAANIGQTNDVIAVILETLGQHPVRNLASGRLG